MECSKKQKNDDTQSTSVDASSSNDGFEEKNEFDALANAKILLSDCLACDSCMTSEEGARVFQQNQKEFFRVLNLNKKCDTSKHKVLAVSICPQSLPYFAAKFNLSVNEAAKRLCGFLKSLGVHYVFDTTIAADFSILESQREFVQRYQRRNQEEHALPMFASACPGWIRYAERVLTNLVTSHICTAKSPQQIMGSLVKGYFARQQNLSPDKIFHVVVAPCYDKKLEALREDFYTALYSSSEVDCVLTSGCLNGKGQAQSEDGKPDRALLAQMEEVYAAIPVRLPETNLHVQRVYQDWLQGMDSEKAQETLHTSYSAVNHTTSSLDIKWYDNDDQLPKGPACAGLGAVGAVPVKEEQEAPQDCVWAETHDTVSSKKKIELLHNNTGAVFGLLCLGCEGVVNCKGLLDEVSVEYFQ
ncbi:hypothetical protein WISP_145634 [Willisornis vidua]|uniref:Iron hydrogenase small subunit domain-containing protein n=1 Tax=Willisornis vidua TaxID=1566151 RepID=A0ABQ9CL15_9PASS|nr:hypothetical protein WISP_145634 [Willisornis vidua]